MPRDKFDIEIADKAGTRVTKTVAAKSMGAALRQACTLAVTSGISEHAQRAVVERRDA